MGVTRRLLAAEVAALFFVANGVLTTVTLFLGPRAYGLGYPLAALLTCAWTYRRLEETLDDLEYLTFATQPMSNSDPLVQAG